TPPAKRTAPGSRHALPAYRFLCKAGATDAGSSCDEGRSVRVRCQEPHLISAVARLVEVDGELGGVQRLARAQVLTGRHDAMPGLEGGHESTRRCRTRMIRTP